MSFRELTMTDIREVLRRWQAGQSARAMALAGVVDRKTAGRYLAAAGQEGVQPTDELTDDVVRRVTARVQTRRPPERSAAMQVLDARRAMLEKWLTEGDCPLRLVRAQELLAREGVAVKYTTLRRWAHAELGWHERASTVRLDDPPPGQEAQVDFGLMGCVTVDGARRKLWVLVVTLSMSRYQFVWPTFTQKVEDLCAGLDAAWRFFGGVPHNVILDNMSAAVARANPKDPKFNPAFQEYVQARGFFADPARVRHPKDKARVENQIPYVRERWFAGETFVGGLAEMRQHAAHWSVHVAGARIHGTTRRVPAEVFRDEEQTHLLPAPTTPFDVPRWSTPKVHPDHHVQVLQALYSVPHRYRGKVRARADSKTVQLYFGTELIKVHPRQKPGQRSTDTADYPPGKAPFAERSVEALVGRAEAAGPHVGQYVQRLVGGPLPWTRMRQAYGLLRLCEHHGSARVDALCRQGLAFDVVDVPRLERMLKRAIQA